MSKLSPDKVETVEVPVVYSQAHIDKELKHWQGKLGEARSGKGSITETACLTWLDKWLDEKNARRGR